MIKNITLKHFKCFESLSLKFGNITLLTGSNSSGKSTIIQSLCVLKQTFSLSDRPTNLVLNGDEVQLGEFSDVLNFSSGRKDLSIEIEVTNQHSILITGARCESMPRIAKLTDIICVKKGTKKNKIFDMIPSVCSPDLARIRNIIRISSERIGPQDVYPAANEYGTGIGIDSRYTPSYINERKNEKISKGKRSPDGNNNYLSKLNDEINSFFENYRIDVNEVEGTNVIKMRFSDLLLGKDIKPMHVGFGVSHVLPILAVGLGSKKGDLIIIENPELHLHPKAQTLLASFLARVVADGIQVIIETHSDHIINGFRKSIKSELLNPSDMETYFFKQKSTLSADVSNQVENIKIDANGDFSNWPTGFFDQLEKDMEQLAGW